MRKVSSITLLSENGEEIDFGLDDIVNISIDDIHQNVSKLSVEYIGEYDVCNTCAIAVKEDVAEKVHLMNYMYTGIAITYSDTTQRVIDLPWLDGWTPAENAYQSDTNANHICIVAVSATQDAADFLDWTETEVEPER